MLSVTNQERKLESPSDPVLLARLELVVGGKFQRTTKAVGKYTARSRKSKDEDRDGT